MSPVRVYSPERDERCPIMLYFHGGGYVKGGIEESGAFCRSLARTSASASPRFAPRHRPQEEGPE